LGRAVGQQIQAYRAGLPLLAPPPARGTVKDISLSYKVWGLQYARQEAQVLSSYQAIADLFQSDGVDGRLLILGEPGMGKTHTLLAVAGILLQRVSRSGGPIPVLVDLAAWAGESLESWLIAYLWDEYRVCQLTATTWLQTAQLTLLLDGFDELSSDRQRSFAKGLDILLRSNVNQTAILCCRRRVLEASGINFGYFNSGVHIAPLAAQQVKTYVLAQNCPALWPRIKASKALQQLARYPLYLSMLVLMAAAISQAEIPITGRASLIRRFCEYQLQREGSRAQDPAALSWLAHQLEQQPHLFRLDQLDRTWLPESQRLLYRGVVGLGLALIFWLVGHNLGLGLAVGLVFSQLDLESFPYTRLSLATASWPGLGVLALASGLPALILGLSFGGFTASILSRFNLGLPAFGWSGVIGAVLGWGLGLSAVVWGGLPQTIQSRQSTKQDIHMALRNTLLLVGLLAGVLALVLVLPPVLEGRSPFTLLLPERLRVLAASLLSTVLWLSFALQHSIIRGLLTLNSRRGWPLMCQPLLRRLVERRLLRQGRGSYWFSHEQVREEFIEREGITG
jgi:hypothetical protein